MTALFDGSQHGRKAGYRQFVGECHPLERGSAGLLRTQSPRVLKSARDERSYDAIVLGLMSPRVLRVLAARETWCRSAPGSGS